MAFVPHFFIEIGHHQLYQDVRHTFTVFILTGLHDKNAIADLISLRLTSYIFFLHTQHPLSLWNKEIIPCEKGIAVSSLFSNLVLICGLAPAIMNFKKNADGFAAFGGVSRVLNALLARFRGVCNRSNRESATLAV